VVNSLLGDLRRSALEGWAASSLRKYASGWNMFVIWCAARLPQLSPMPASELTVALYLQQRMNEGNSIAAVKSSSAAISMMHKANLHAEEPTKGLLPGLVRRANRRKFGTAATRDKEPFLWSDAVQLAVFCAPAEPVCWACIALAALLSFAGFCRHSDAALLLWRDIAFASTHVELTFTLRKNNQYKLKQRVRIASLPAEPVCVVALLRAWRLRTYAGLNSPVFRGFDGHAAFRNPAASRLGALPLAYEQYARYLRQLLAPIVGISAAEFQRRFGTQSCRSGGASAAANAGIPFEVWGQHGSWRSRDAQLVYMSLDLDACLSTTRAILGSAGLGLTEGEAILLSSDSEDDEVPAPGA
jgi:integrase